jgi:ribokinase
MLVVGSANMDLVVRTRRAPDAGETVMGLDHATYPGGKGANQAVAARRAGATVAFAACLGRDAHGDALQATLAAEDVDLSLLRRVAAPSGVALITVEDGGQNRIVVVPGANQDLRPERLPDMAPAGLLLAQLEVPVETVLAAARRTRAAGGRTVLNASPVDRLDPATQADLLAETDILVVNETEAAALLGTDSSDAAPEEMSERLAAGRLAAIVTLGAAGVVWHAGEAGGRVAAHRVPVVDTTACGDAFAGALAASIEAGGSIETAVRFGNAAGALAATRTGAQPSLPTRDAILDLLTSDT